MGNRLVTLAATVLMSGSSGCVQEMMGGGRVAQERNELQRAQWRQEEHQARKDYVAAHPELDEHTKHMILIGNPAIGMTQEQVRISMGSPRRVRTVTTGSGATQQWEYGTEYRTTHFLYFENGKLSTIQEN